MQLNSQYPIHWWEYAFAWNGGHLALGSFEIQPLSNDPLSKNVQRKLSWRGKTYSYPHPNFKGSGYTTEINKGRKVIYAKIIFFLAHCFISTELASHILGIPSKESPPKVGSLEKTLMLGKIEGFQKGKGAAENEMVG